MLLNPCKICGGAALEQVRGLMTAADKGWVPADNSGNPDLTPDPTKPEAWSSNAPWNATDTRVVCGNVKMRIYTAGRWVELSDSGEVWNQVKLHGGDGAPVAMCDAATGWNKAEFADYSRFKWNRDHGAERAE